MGQKSGVVMLFGALEVLAEGKQQVGKGNIPGYTRVPSKADLDRYFKGCGGNYRGYDTGSHWCGIFATYLMKLAGVNCHWVMGKGIQDDSNGADLEVILDGVTARKDIIVGDILVREPNHHHIIALDGPKSGSIRCIEGNAGGIKYPLLAMDWAANAHNNQVGNVSARYRILT